MNYFVLPGTFNRDVLQIVEFRKGKHIYLITFNTNTCIWYQLHKFRIGNPVLYNNYFFAILFGLMSRQDICPLDLTPFAMHVIPTLIIIQNIWSVRKIGKNFWKLFDISFRPENLKLPRFLFCGIYASYFFSFLCSPFRSGIFGVCCV